MISKEIRIMGGPNMWSKIPKLLVVKLSYAEPLPAAINSLPDWASRNLDVKLDQAGDPHLLLTTLIAELIRYLQPVNEQLYADARLLGQNSYYAIVEYGDKDAGAEALYTACEIIEALLQEKDSIPLSEAKEKIAGIYRHAFLGPSTSTIVEAAIKRNIPVRRAPGGFIVFGQGARQKKIAASISDNTSDISVDIAGDKELTKQILNEALIPVPKGFLISNEESIKELLPEIEFPVVVKPLNANQGKGITSHIRSGEELREAFRLAKTYSRSVIIEKHIQGNDYRFLVIGYKVIAVAHRIPACVIGNGKLTIAELINQVNENPLRGDGHGSVLTKITADESTLNILKAKHLTLDSILEQGELLYLKDTANLSTGGTATDVTDDVHPDNLVLAERIAALIGLDICGIDIMAPDVETPITENGGAVLEVNAAPGLRMHVSPSKGPSRNIGDPIIDLLYPKGTSARIPIVAVTGTNGKTTTCRLMAHLAAAQGHRVGFTTTDGIYLNNTRIFKGDCSGPQSAKLILKEPLVDFAVLECARGGIIRSGLAFDTCNIAIITNVAEDHLGLKDIYTVEDLARVKAVVPQSVTPDGYAILNAADDLVYAMKKDLACRVALFCLDAAHPRMVEHRRHGGYAVALDDNGDIVIFQGDWQLRICHVKDVPLTLEGKAGFMIENVLPVALAGHLLGFPPEKISAALQDFEPSAEQTPGRLNRFEINGVHVILDYAHNPHGLKAFGKYLKTLGHKVTGIIAAVGDRRDNDIVEFGRVAADVYDEIIIRFDKDTRGRSTDEIASLIIKGILEVKPLMSYHIIADSEAALLFALEQAPPGSVVVISADDNSDSISMIGKLKANYNPVKV